MDETSLIPRSALFGDPAHAHARVSPDGCSIAFLGRRKGVLNIWVAPWDAPDEARPATGLKGRGIHTFYWTFTGRHLIYPFDAQASGHVRLYSLDFEDGSTRDLTPIEGVNARALKLSPSRPHELVAGLNDRDPVWHDLYCIDLRTGERRLLMQNQGFMGFILDEGFTPCVAARMLPDGGSEYLTPGAEGAWKTLWRVPPEDALAFAIHGFTPDGEGLYASDSRGRNSTALVRIDLSDGETTQLIYNPECDIDEVVLHPVSGEVQAVCHTLERKRWTFLDREFEVLFSKLRSFGEGEPSIVSRSGDDTRWIVEFVRDDGPVSSVLFETKRAEGHLLFLHCDALRDCPLVPMHSDRIRSSDGLTLHVYYSLPAASVGPTGRRPAAALPTVLLVHAGPWSRDRWGFMPVHQWLANRGYLALAVNFRGSTGFGKEFQNAGDGEWGGRILDDLVDTVDWAVREGIARSDKVALMGGSFGGYATLACLCFQPKHFACGIAINPPSDLVRFIEGFPGYGRATLDLLRTRIGDPALPEERRKLEATSPVNYAHRIERPVLIVQGGQDPRVRRTDTDRFIQNLREHGKPVVYLLYPDEGHGMTSSANVRSFFGIAEAFLASVLGGRCEPLGADLKGASVQLLAGAQLFPDALRSTLFRHPSITDGTLQG